MKQEHQELPTGKVVIRLFNEDGSPHREQPSYGDLEIGIMIEFQNGEKAGEFYYSKRRMCSRKTYESRRASYPDMPAADSVSIRILVCEIAVEEGGLENTGHLVVELPREPAKRANVLKTIARIARRQGYEGDPDDGQNYAYVKLD